MCIKVGHHSDGEITYLHNSSSAEGKTNLLATHGTSHRVTTCLPLTI